MSSSSSSALLLTSLDTSLPNTETILPTFPIIHNKTRLATLATLPYTFCNKDFITLQPAVTLCITGVTCQVSRVTRAAVLDMTISRRQEGDRDQALHWPDVRCNDSSIPCINCINSSTPLQTHSHLHMSAMTVILSNFRHCYCHSLVTHLQLLSRALISSWSTYHYHVSRSPSLWIHLFIVIFAVAVHCVLMLVVTKGFMSPPRVIMSALKCILFGIAQSNLCS